MTTVTVDFRGTQETILKEMVSLGIVKTKAEALRLALMNFALTTGLLSKEKVLEEIRILHRFLSHLFIQHLK